MMQKINRTELTFRKCARGFLFTEGYDINSDRMGEMFAFDRIEDAARWLIDRYVLEQAA